MQVTNSHNDSETVGQPSLSLYAKFGVVSNMKRC